MWDDMQCFYCGNKVDLINAKDSEDIYIDHDLYDWFSEVHVYCSSECYHDCNDYDIDYTLQP